MRPVLMWVVAGLLGLASLPGEAREPGSSRRYEQWKKADTDADGRLSRTEAAAMPALRPHFDAIDCDRDGRLSTDEVRAWRARAPKGARRSPPSGIASLVERADANGDGVLTRAEAASLPRLAERFDAIDADRDGRLSREEISAWLAARRALREGLRSAAQ
jgi:Ca2+-binding EF-hand superfamily protein